MDIHNKIKQLLILGEQSPNEHEAKIALSKAQELMAKYHIDSVDMKDTPYIRNEMRISASYGGSAWVRTLLGVICHANGVMLLYYNQK